MAFGVTYVGDRKERIFFDSLNPIRLSGETACIPKLMLTAQAEHWVWIPTGLIVSS